MLELFGALTTALIAVLVLPTALYAWFERKGRSAWPAPPSPPPVDFAFAGYRRARSVTEPTPEPRAPARVRAMAYTCFAFGQMIVPGALFGFFGFCFVPSSILLSLPGVAIAWCELSLGRHLLLRTPGVAQKARWFGWIAGGPNALFLLMALAAPGFLKRASSSGSVFDADDDFLWRFASAMWPYALASLGQAIALALMARGLEPARPAKPTHAVAVASGA
jgi:hypothetical protein